MAKHGQQKEQIHIEALRDPRWDRAERWLIAQQLQHRGLARLRAVTRHQLFVSSEIPYTSHNSSACLAMDFFADDYAAVVAHCRDYLLRESAEGSDAGLCVGREAASACAAVAFGKAAKARVLTQPAAHAEAAACGFHLEGLTGTHQGVIGAFSAVALHATRSDGRFLWMRGVRDLKVGPYALAELRASTDIEAFVTTAGQEVSSATAQIVITEWARPVLADGRSVLYLEEEPHEQTHPHRWRVADKAFIKQF